MVMPIEYTYYTFLTVPPPRSCPNVYRYQSGLTNCIIIHYTFDRKNELENIINVVDPDFWSFSIHSVGFLSNATQPKKKEEKKPKEYF